MSEPKLNEAVAKAWSEYQERLSALAPIVETVGLVQRAFEIGFAEGCYYTVRRLTPNGTLVTEPQPENKGEEG